jgi:hypothetical protein
MPGARCARSLACKIKKHTSIVTTVTPGSPGIPRAMVLTVSFVLFPVTGLCCHRHQQVTTCRLDASVGASEPHDFAVRLTCCSSKAPLASIASCPAFVTIASRPSVEQDGAVLKMIWGKREAEYFCAEGWTGQPLICPAGTHRGCGSQSVRLRFRWNLSMNTRTCHAAAPRLCRNSKGD